jgi:hypothetical protein
MDEEVTEENGLVQSEQTELTVRKFDENGTLVSKVVSTTTQYVPKADTENIGFYM